MFHIISMQLFMCSSYQSTLYCVWLCVPASPHCGPRLSFFIPAHYPLFAILFATGVLRRETMVVRWIAPTTVLFPNECDSPALCRHYPACI